MRLNIIISEKDCLLSACLRYALPKDPVPPVINNFPFDILNYLVDSILIIIERLDKPLFELNTSLT